MNAATHRAVLPIRFTCPPAVPTGLPCPACNNRVERRLFCFPCSGTGSLDHRITAILTTAVVEAINLIRTGHPGRGEYRLARAQLSVANLIGATAEALEVDWLRYFELGAAPC